MTNPLPETSSPRTAPLDLVVQVADARNLRRALTLTPQIAAAGHPMVLVLNMTDEAASAGVDVDAPGLSRALGIPVVEMVAVDGQGLSELRAALASGASRGTPVPSADQARWAHDTAEQFRHVSRSSRARVGETINRLVRHPLTGLPVLAAVLYALYLFVGVFGAQTLVGLVEHRLFGQWINPAAIRLVNATVGWPILRDLLVGQYGLITMGLTYALAIVLPVVTTFFLAFSWLEDSGYLPRLAIFSDRLFRMMGLNGRAVLPMVLGLGCDTMATMTTRILSTRKERIIATLLLALGIPCSAQLATILGILGGISFGALATLFLVVLGQMFLVGVLAARVLPGERSDFIMELPPMRLPRLGNVLAKTGQRIRWYLAEAVPIFIAGTLLLFVLSSLGWLGALTRAAEPVVVGLLGLPRQAAEVFVMGFLRRDYGAAGLFQMAHNGSLAPAQAVVALTVMTLFVPCVANFLMIVKEQGMKIAFLILTFVTVVAVATGAGLHYVIDAVGIGF